MNLNTNLLKKIVTAQVYWGLAKRCQTQ